MPATQTGAESRRRATTRSTARKTPSQDAIALLKADHREVEALFEQFEKTRSADKKLKLAQKICTALKVHTQIEEEIFYPVCREDGVEDDTMDEAYVEHDGAKKLIAEIEAAEPGDDYYDAQVHVLSEMIQHHVKEEEQRGGMFAQAKDKGVDMKALGEKLAARKQALMARMRQ
ncbi:MAG: hemerythrin domain-containing protein [Pseudomonadota bacterium]